MPLSEPLSDASLLSLKLSGHGVAVSVPPKGSAQRVRVVTGAMGQVWAQSGQAAQEGGAS